MHDEKLTILELFVKNFLIEPDSKLFTGIQFVSGLAYYIIFIVYYKKIYDIL